MSLKTDLQAIIDASGAEMGVAIHHLESGERCDLNADHFFPMASVLKIPVLAEAFRQLEAGRFRLDDRWSLSDDQKNRGSGILPFFAAGLTPSVLDLLTLMMIISDNTATDMIIHRLGGPEAIESAMHQLGLTDIYFKLTIKDLLADCLPPLQADTVDSASNSDPDETRQTVYETGFKRDSVAFSRGADNNVSTPKAMTDLLSLIFRGEIVGPAATEQMLDILLKQQFNARLPRFLPRDTKFAHKTGTLAGTRNDSGLIYLNDQGHVALTLYTIWDDTVVWGDPVATHERIFAVETAMGQIGRLVYDYFRA